MNRKIPDYKKHAYWDHFVARAYEHDGFPSGITPKRLREIKPGIWTTAFFWHDILHRHMDRYLRPDELKSNSLASYEHAQSNFGGMIKQAMRQAGWVK